jgi:type IX secretion system PorP/SprF family membrane protein
MNLLNKNFKYILAQIVFLFVINAFAQQRAQYTQYIMNNYLSNPAAGGVSDYWDIKAGYRNQWTGFDGAPKTFFVSGHGSIGYPHKRVRGSAMKPHHGIGGYLYTDKTGPITWSGAYGSYSYHLKLTNKITASMGAFFGLMQYQLKGSELVFVQNPNDPAVNKNDITKITPDASVGVWLYSEHFFIGASANQILQSKLKLGLNETSVPSTGRLNNHYFVTAGYKIELNNELDLIPTTMIKYVYAAPLQVDVNARLKYRDMVWGGISYRHQDAVALFAGIIIHEDFEIGYSYDFTTSSIRKTSGGSHEIILGVKLPFKSKRILCPNNFWD